MFTSIILSIAIFFSVIYVKSAILVWVSKEKINSKWVDTHENISFVILILACVMWGLFYYLTK